MKYEKMLVFVNNLHDFSFNYDLSGSILELSALINRGDTF